MGQISSNRNPEGDGEEINIAESMQLIAYIFSLDLIYAIHME